MLTARTTLQAVSPLLLAWHKRADGSRARLNEIVGGGFAPPAVAAGLLRLRSTVHDAGGVLIVTTLERSYDDQAAAHEADPGRAVAAGLSLHQGPYAIDADIPGSALSRERWSAAALEAGWTPIGTTGEEHHWQHLGEWAHVYERLGSNACAMAMCLDLGHARYGRDEVRALQAGCHRVGVYVGDIDGYPGPLLEAGLAQLKMPTAGYRDLHQLESRVYW